jgi:hypothetical protein
VVQKIIVPKCKCIRLPHCLWCCHLVHRVVITVYVRCSVILLAVD